MRTLKRLLASLVVILVFLSLVLAILIPITVRRSFPQTSGEISIQGLKAPVDIYRDSFGIPHIYGASLHDIFFAQGYIHAQDRFWQMDFWRHIGSGRLSEMFGESQVETDVFLRTLGWRRVAEAEWQNLDPTSREILNAYAEGVNSYLEDHQGSALSLEYAILKLLTPTYQPEPWEPVHSLTWAKAMAWDLRGNMEEELERVRQLKVLTPDQVEQLNPPYPQDHPLIVASDELAARSGEILSVELADLSRQLELHKLEQRLAALEKVLGPTGPGIGSNNWVISGQRTATGMPLLANDPHLGIQMPSIWYEVGLHCAPQGPDCPLAVTGFSFAGAPGVIIGHNDRLAWGFTNVGPDVIDLFIEKLNPDNPNQYEVNGAWVDMQLVQETVSVAGGEPVQVTVRYTRHGPLIWDDAEALEQFRKDAGRELPESYGIAIRWTALDSSGTFPAIWQINLAQNWEEFRAATSLFNVPSQNMVYADVDGNIGYQTPGQIPIRRSGDGRLPVPGWTDDYEWVGYIPFEDLPFSFNPDKGYIVTANNAVVGLDYPYLISTDWDFGFRAARIVELIENAPGPIDSAYIQKMQGDGKDLVASEIVPVLLKIPLSEARLEKARSILATWEFQDGMDSAPAALYNVFWRHLLAGTFHDELPEGIRPGGGSLYGEIMRQLVKEPNSSWWDNQTTTETEDMATIFTQSLRLAVTELEQSQGKDPARWQWGQLHTATFRNATLGESGIAPIEALFNRGPFPTSGGESIINATGWNMTEPYGVDWLPSMRMIVDLGNLANSLTIHTTGQSGHAYHPNYIDMADLWRLIQYHPMLWELQQVQAAATNHLRLVP